MWGPEQPTARRHTRSACVACAGLMVSLWLATSAAAVHVSLHDRGPCPDAADGLCIPNRRNFGYYLPRWRPWPGERPPAPAVTPEGPPTVPSGISPFKTPRPEEEENFGRPVPPGTTGPPAAAAGKPGEAERPGAAGPPGAAPPAGTTAPPGTVPPGQTAPGPTAPPTGQDAAPQPPLDMGDAPPPLPRELWQQGTSPQPAGSDLGLDMPLPEPSTDAPPADEPLGPLSTAKVPTDRPAGPEGLVWRPVGSPHRQRPASEGMEMAWNTPLEAAPSANPLRGGHMRSDSLRPLAVRPRAARSLPDQVSAPAESATSAVSTYSDGQAFGDSGLRPNPLREP